MQVKNFSPLECVQPKCSELNRMKDILVDKLSKRTEKLLKCKELMERIQRVSVENYDRVFKNITKSTISLK